MTTEERRTFLKETLLNYIRMGIKFPLDWAVEYFKLTNQILNSKENGCKSS